MREFPKPIVFASKCLGFDHCRWNGLTISSEVVEKLKPFVEYKTVCPEVEIGLGVPRDPIRVVFEDDQLKLLQPATGRDVTKLMHEFTKKYLDSVGDVDGWLLKNRSPSCGFQDVKIYPGTENVSPLKKDRGFFGGEVLSRYHKIAVEDEGRLKNFKIREHFFTKLFSIAAFRQVKQKGGMGALVKFQTENKLLFMAYNQKELRILGRIVANPDRLPLETVLENYEVHFYQALAKPSRIPSNINVLMHGMGYFSKQLSHKEKAFFLDALEQYRSGTVPLSVPTNLIKSWIIRFDQQYLMQQSFFEPFPGKLVEITDSGKGRDY
ncbi:MAG TPA: DUF1722 domain-containing protein [bacterium]|nr:DUF1722 domain-containing protein [bacterium]